jgi:hypothetical protein
LNVFLFLYFGEANRYLNADEARDFLRQKYPYLREFTTRKSSSNDILESFFHDTHITSKEGAISINKSCKVSISDYCFIFVHL